MKKIFTLIAAALMSASMFAQPATVPTVQDLTDAGYDLTSRVICLYFDEQVYYDIVWAGSYNGWSIDNPASMIHFEPLEGYQGWYACQVNDDSDPCQGKPVQLKKDGSFSWDFQSGDVEAWTNMAQPGTKTATISVGNDQSEANCTWPTTGAYIYEVAYFKNHNSPYVAPEEYKYTEYEKWQIKYEGSDWVNMTKVEEGLFMLAEINWKTRSGFKVKSDDNPIKKDWYDVDDPDVVIGEEAIPPVTVDVYLRVIDDETLKIGIGVEPPIQFVDTASGLKFEITSMEEPRTVKVIFNDYPGTSCTVPGTVTYGEETFDVTEIGEGAFHDCSSLESITLPESVTTLAYASLADSGLKSITIPATVTTIGEYAFAGCPLQSVTFQGNDCQFDIGEDAFYNVGSTEIPATLVLPDTWTGSTPDQDGNWYGGHFDYDAPAPEYKYTEYENWQIKYGNTWVWSGNMTKVEEGLFKLEIYWEGTGFNVKSDENPIKEDWFAPKELVIGEEVIAPVTVDVYLKVVDDETVKIGVGVIPDTGPTVDKTGITVNGRKYGFPVRLVKEVK